MSLLDKLKYACGSAERYYTKRPDFVLMDEGTFIDFMKESELYSFKDYDSKGESGGIKVFGMDVVVQTNTIGKPIMKVCYYG